MTALVDQCREMLQAGATVDDVVGLMRREGQSRVESIVLVMEITGMSLPEAKTAVHTSSAWADLRQEAERFQENLHQVAEQDSKDGRTRD